MSAWRKNIISLLTESQAAAAKTRMMGLEGASEVQRIQTLFCFPDEKRQGEEGKRFTQGHLGVKSQDRVQRC